MRATGRAAADPRHTHRPAVHPFVVDGVSAERVRARAVVRKAASCVASTPKACARSRCAGKFQLTRCFGAAFLRGAGPMESGVETQLAVGRVASSASRAR